MINHQKIIKNYLEMVVKGYSNSLILVSKAGLGKTTLLMNTMKELKLEKHYLYCNSYITSLQLFKILDKTNKLDDPRILILDDVEMILKDKLILGLLKGALWEANGKRIVNYNSSTPKIQDNTIIPDFKGRIVFLLNEFLSDNELIKALKDRGLYYELKMTNDQILDFMAREMVKDKTQQKVFYYLKSLVKNDTELSYRTLVKAFQIHACSPNHWREIVRTLI